MKKIYAHMTRDDLEDAYAQCSRTNEEYSVSLTTAEARIVTLEESLHYCNGTADLAIQHRDVAEAENDRLSKLADVSIAANVEADGLRSERDRAVADGAALRGVLEKLAWETVADKGGSEASVCRLCGGVLDHVPDCILSTGHPGAGVHAMVEAAEEYVSVKRVLVTGPKVNSAFARLCDALDGDVTATFEHDWVDARNSVVKDGEWCRKCNAIRSGNEATDGRDGNV